jgi:hypothetical protein
MCSLYAGIKVSKYKDRNRPAAPELDQDVEELWYLMGSWMNSNLTITTTVWHCSHMALFYYSNKTNLVRRYSGHVS